MIVTAVKTRMVHAAVRHLLPQSPWWPEVNGEKPIPISQADIMVTWHTLATFAMSKLHEWRLRMLADEVEGFLHLWQVPAHMLGVLDEHIPNSWDEANAQSAQVLDPVLGATREGIVLADILLDLAMLDLNGDGDRGSLRVRAQRRRRDGGRPPGAVGPGPAAAPGPAGGATSAAVSAGRPRSGRGRASGWAGRRRPGPRGRTRPGTRRR
ncbi:MAG TPA: oxygenase MpaB family protein [Acidimicrobiales bacterium]